MDGANLLNATIDRSVFDGASMRGTKFINAVITGGWACTHASKGHARAIHARAMQGLS